MHYPDPNPGGAVPWERWMGEVVGKVTVTVGDAVDEVVEIVSTLIRFDTTNTGEPETTRGEADCARWVAAQLEEAGYRTEYVESGAPGRGNLVGGDLDYRTIFAAIDAAGYRGYVGLEFRPTGVTAAAIDTAADAAVDFTAAALAEAVQLAQAA